MIDWVEIKFPPVNLWVIGRYEAYTELLARRTHTV
jgi:hypothetical protein